MGDSCVNINPAPYVVLDNCRLAQNVMVGAANATPRAFSLGTVTASLGGHHHRPSSLQSNPEAPGESNLLSLQNSLEFQKCYIVTCDSAIGRQEYVCIYIYILTPTQLIHSIDCLLWATALCSGVE